MKRCLGDIIVTLQKAVEEHGRDLVMPRGFKNPHSYRGYYEELAFEPAENVTLGEMLDAAEEADGATYQGYKGGSYTMDSFTWCWIALHGHTGEGIGTYQIETMIELALAKKEAE